MSSVGRHDVVVAGQHHRRARRDQRRRHGRSAARTRPACSRTSAPAADCRWAGRGRRPARRSPPPRCSGPGDRPRSPGRARAGQHRLGAARQDGDAVPAPLAPPDRAVAGRLDRRRRERASCSPSAPAGRPRPAAAFASHSSRLGSRLIDVVDVEGGDLHFQLRSSRRMPGPRWKAERPRADAQRLSGPHLSCWRNSEDGWPARCARHSGSRPPPG